MIHLFKTLLIFLLLSSSLFGALIFEDKEGVYLPEQVMADDSLFTPIKDYSIGFSNSVYWIKINLQKNQNTNSDYYILFDQATIENATAYAIIDGRLQIQRSGNKIPISERTVKSPTTAFYYSLNEVTENLDVYISIQGEQGLHFQYEIGDFNLYTKNITLHSYLAGIAIFPLIVLILFNIILFISTRDTSYIYYVMGMAGLTGSALYMFNFTSYIGWLAPYSYQLGGTSAGLMSTGAYLFIRKLIMQNATKLENRLWIVGFVFALSLFLLMWPFPGIFRIIMYGPGEVLYLILLFIITRQAFMGNTLAKIIGFGWLFYVLGIIHVSGSILGIIDGASGMYSFIFGGLIEAIAFAAALAYRFRLLENEKHQLQMNYTLKLEEKVKARTHELLVLKESAEQASQFKSEFLANMSHEIRTPMNGVLGFVEQLIKKENDPQKLQQLNAIQNSGNTLLYIINDILDYSKIESSKMTLELQPCRIHRIFEDTTEMFSQIASKKDITLQSKIDKKIPECIMGDEVRLKQILFNLLSNAVKFTSNNGTVTLESKYIANKDTLYIGIIDTGIGIATENLDKIFKVFSQEDTSTTRKFGGTGLGLSIASQLTALMGGELLVESEQGKGSRFYFEISLQSCPNDTQANTSEHDVATKSLENLTLSGHILVAEDNQTNQMLMGMILDDFGLSYDIAVDGLEAISMFEKTNYDLILMDENMPNMNGIEASDKIRNSEKERNLQTTPIIAVTANALANDRERFLDAGMDDYISKPYTQEDIAKVLKKFL